MPVVKAELGFLQVQFKGLGGYAVALGKSPLCVAPERLDSVDVVLATGKLVVAVVDSEVLVKADVDEAVVAAPAVGMDGCAGVDLDLALEDAEDYRLAACPASALDLDTVRPEVGLVDINASVLRYHDIQI
jgi:hypothetical protein